MARPVHIAGVRHHSPACAAAVRALIQHVRPAFVLVEGPADFTPLIPELTDDSVVPPVAVVGLAQAESGLTTTILPLTEHSPEFIALREAKLIGAEARFIDRVSGLRSLTPAMEAVAGDERWFMASAFVKSLCATRGWRDGAEAWDAMFESRLGHTDWQGFLRDAEGYGAALREAEPPDDECLLREAVMAHAIQEAAECGPVVAIVGAFHAGALRSTKPAHGEPRSKGVQTFVAASSHGEINRLSGYAAGLPTPRYYEQVWRRFEAGDRSAALWRTAALDLFLDFASTQRQVKSSHKISSPLLIEAVAAALRLADLRSLAGPGRSELLDAARSVFVKDGDPDLSASVVRVFEDFLAGSRLGAAPLAQSVAPLLADARMRAKKLGFALDDAGRRKRDLDIHRSARARLQSQFLHAMTILNTGIGVCHTGASAAPGGKASLLRESWTVAWTPNVELVLIRAATLGLTVEAAALRRLEEGLDAIASTGARDASAAAHALWRAQRAGLIAHMGGLVARVAAEIDADDDFSRTVQAAIQICNMLRASESHGLEITELAERAMAQVLRRADQLANTPTSRQADASTALAQMRRLFADGQGRNEDDWRLVLHRLLARDAPPMIEGAVRATSVAMGLSSAVALAERIVAGLQSATVDPSERSHMLAGAILSAPEALVLSADTLRPIDAALKDLDEETFLEVLPGLRAAFRALHAHDRVGLSSTVASLHGLSALRRDEIVADAALLARNAALTNLVRTHLRIDGDMWVLGKIR